MLVTARNPHMLVWSGVELIFFTVSDLGLCFEFVLETEMITQGCFYFCWSGLTQSQDFFFCFCLWECTRWWEEHSQDSWSQPIQVTFQTDPGDIPDLMVSWSAYRAGEEILYVRKGFLLHIWMRWHLCIMCPTVTCHDEPCLSFQLCHGFFRKKNYLLILIKSLFSIQILSSLDTSIHM